MRYDSEFDPPRPAAFIARFQDTADSTIPIIDDIGADAGGESETLLNVPGFLRSVPGAPGTSPTLPDESIRREPNVLSETPHLRPGAEIVGSPGLPPASRTHEIS